MKRFCFLLLSLLPVFGCFSSARMATPTLTPVAVDEAAAYPSQDPGTKPPVLTGFTSLSKELLDEGWVQLFDGVSTFGWQVTEGDGTLSVMSDGSQNYLVFDKKDHEQATISHRICEAEMRFDNSGGSSNSISRKGWTSPWSNAQWGATFSDGTIGGDIKLREGITEIRAKRSSRIQQLTESDWKPVAGQCEAKWTDGVLELTGGSGMLETVKEYGDFVLQLEYFTEKGVNSGVFFRCIPGENMNGYECQIFNSPPDDDYTKFIGTDTGGIFRRQVGRNVGPKDGEWNYLTIDAHGAVIATWVNGIQVTDWTDTREEDQNPRNGKRLQPGTIQLQGHDPTTKILFRNFRIVEL